MRDPLKGLSEDRRSPAPELDLAEAFDGHLPAPQLLGKNPTGGYGVLHGEVDSDTADG
jgi:hypothetical protein